MRKERDIMSELLPRSRNDHQHGEEPLQGSPETATVFDRDAATTRRNKMLRNVAAFTLGGVLLSGGGYAFGNRGGNTVEKAPAVATAPTNPDAETAPVVTPEATPTTIDIDTFRENFPYETRDEEGNVTKYESRAEFIEAQRVTVEDNPTGEDALKTFIKRFNVQLETAANVDTHVANRSFEDPERPEIPAGAEAVASAVYDDAFSHALYYEKGVNVGLAETLAENHDGYVAAVLANTDEVRKGQNKLTAKYTYKKLHSQISTSVGKTKAFYAQDVEFTYTDNGGSIPDIATQRLTDNADSIDKDGNVHREYIRDLSLRTEVDPTNKQEYWVIDGSHA